MAVPTFDLAERSGAFRILLVDDNNEFREIITKQLEKMGCCVHSTAEAGDFLTKLLTAQVPYDLAIVDIYLPGLPGDQIISWLRESEQRSVSLLPVLIVTGYPDSLPDTLLIDGTKVSLLCKPYRYSELEAAVTRSLLAAARPN